MHGCQTLGSDELHCLGGADILGGPWQQWLPELARTPAFPPDVLVYTLAPDSDAELRGKDGIRVERRFAVKGGL